jgi:hypothetical protein
MTLLETRIAEILCYGCERKMPRQSNGQGDHFCDEPGINYFTACTAHAKDKILALIQAERAEAAHAEAEWWQQHSRRLILKSATW